MAKRDHNDSTRDVAPLKPATDAIRIDSTSMTVAQVVEVMIEAINLMVS
jgi:cytidylate kinase